MGREREILYQRGYPQQKASVSSGQNSYWRTLRNSKLWHGLERIEASAWHGLWMWRMAESIEPWQAAAARRCKEMMKIKTWKVKKSEHLILSRNQKSKSHSNWRVLKVCSWHWAVEAWKSLPNEHDLYELSWTAVCGETCRLVIQTSYCFSPTASAFRPSAIVNVMGRSDIFVCWGSLGPAPLKSVFGGFPKLVSTFVSQSPSGVKVAWIVGMSQPYKVFLGFFIINVLVAYIAGLKHLALAITGNRKLLWSGGSQWSRSSKLRTYWCSWPIAQWCSSRFSGSSLTKDGTCKFLFEIHAAHADSKTLRKEPWRAHWKQHRLPHLNLERHLWMLFAGLKVWMIRCNMDDSFCDADI